MKPSSQRDVPKGAAITVVALVLLASIAIGREDPAPAPDRTPQLAVTDRSVPSANDAIPLEIDRLQRTQGNAPVTDVFALPAPPSPPPTTIVAISKPARPPAPSAPPLPFRYLGRMTEDRQTLLIVAKGEAAYSALPGETLDERYRLLRMDDTSATFVYLPLGIKQTLALPARESKEATP